MAGSVGDVGNLYAAVGAVEEGGRVAEFGLILLEWVSFHDVIRAHVHVANHRGGQFLVNVAVTDELAACDPTAIGGHDAGVGRNKIRDFFVETVVPGDLRRSPKYVGTDSGLERGSL